jgi:hypothetical protein
MGALMELNPYSLIGLLAFLILGIFEVMVLQRVLYPMLRWRFEKAKTTQSQGTDPNRIMTLLRIQSLIILPALGFVLGGRLQKLFG